jgi:hypothetical protein
MPTFALPSCSITPTLIPTEATEAVGPTEVIGLTTSTESHDPLITPAPASPTTDCPALFVCVDGVKECGEGDKRFE